MSDLAISTTRLMKSYGDKSVLDGIDLEVAAGEVFALLGPNGAGKTTTVNILSTLRRPDGGRAEVFGLDVVRQGSQVRPLIGLTGQFSAIDGLLTGRENLALVAALAHLPKSRPRQRVDEMLERFDLGDAASKRASTYSGGMRRRLDLAMTLIARPRLVFLDEPTTGLDPRSRRTMWDIVSELVASGVTIFLTTQYLDEADALADRIAVLDGGRIVANDTAAGLKRLIPGGHVDLAFASATDFDRARGLWPEASARSEALSLSVAGDGEPDTCGRSSPASKRRGSNRWESRSRRRASTTSSSPSPATAPPPRVPIRRPPGPPAPATAPSPPHKTPHPPSRRTDDDGHDTFHPRPADALPPAPTCLVGHGDDGQTAVRPRRPLPCLDLPRRRPCRDPPPRRLRLRRDARARARRRRRGLSRIHHAGDDRADDRRRHGADRALGLPGYERGHRHPVPVDVDLARRRHGRPRHRQRPPAVRRHRPRHPRRVAIGFRPHADVVGWLGFAGFAAAIILALGWLSVALGVTAKSVESASNLPMIFMLLPMIGSGFVPTDTMPGWIQAFADWRRSRPSSKPSAACSWAPRSAPTGGSHCCGWSASASSATSSPASRTNVGPRSRAFPRRGDRRVPVIVESSTASGPGGRAMSEAAPVRGPHAPWPKGCPAGVPLRAGVQPRLMSCHPGVHSRVPTSPR